MSNSTGWSLFLRLPLEDQITGVVVTFIDITSRKQSEEFVRMSEEPLPVVIEGTHDFAMILFDAEGNIAAWNVGAEGVLGYSERDAVGQSGTILLAGPQREAAWASELANARRQGKVSEDTLHLRKDGSKFWGNGVLHTLYDSHRQVTGFVKLVRDDSIRKKSGDLKDASIDHANQARMESEWAISLRDRFVAVLSHELRTPLSAILIWAQVLQTKGMTDEQREQGLKAIERSAESQKDLLNELLDTSRIASGKIQLQWQPTDVSELVRSAIETIRPNAQAAEIAVDVNLPDQEVITSIDAGRIRQVLMNLLTNAIRFNSRPGKIGVTLRLFPHDLQIDVEDSGRGIPAEFLPHVFKPFSQQDTASPRTHGGRGLGLAISNQLVELHGGTIQASSPGENCGSRFSIRLPYTRSTPAASRPGRADGPPPAIPAGTRILLIEDDDQTRVGLANLFQRAGAGVEAIRSAADVLPAFDRVRPHIVVSDIGLSGEDGFSMLRRLRVLEEERGLPPTIAIALTAFASEDDPLKAIVAGFQQHVSKPVDGDLLLRVIAGYLSEGKPTA